jgi:hypothetical protein
MPDAFTSRYQDLLIGTYDCVDRIVMKAYFSIGHSPSGLRYWWRQMYGSDEKLDETHLMRMAERFARRLYTYANANHIPVIKCLSGTNKHQIGEEHLAKNPQVQGLFLILVARAQGLLWEVKRGQNGFLKIQHKARRPFINYYYFHINDPQWGHITIRMASHPPFAAMIILNGHEFVAAQLKKAGHSFSKEGNCFTKTQDCSDLALVADTLRQQDAIGRLSQVCERWIYSTCLCFALTTDEQQRSGFRYDFSVYQVEYSRNLLFRSPLQMEQVVETMLDRSRSRLRMPKIKTILGLKHRPKRRKNPMPRMEVVVEKPEYDLTYFNLYFGKLSVKAYTKGEHVLRFEAITHNTEELRCGRVLTKFPDIVCHLQGVLTRFLDTLEAVDRPFISKEDWDGWSTHSVVGKARVGGVDIHKPRMRSVLEAILALAPAPQGFTASEVAAKVCALSGQPQTAYGPSRAAYDLRKLRGKHVLEKIDKSHRYQALPEGLRAIAATLVLREKVIKPVLASVSTSKPQKQAEPAVSLDSQYQALCTQMNSLLQTLGVAA